MVIAIDIQMGDFPDFSLFSPKSLVLFSAIPLLEISRVNVLQGIRQCRHVSIEWVVREPWSMADIT